MCLNFSKFEDIYVVNIGKVNENNKACNICLFLTYHKNIVVLSELGLGELAKSVLPGAKLAGSKTIHDENLGNLEV